MRAIRNPALWLFLVAVIVRIALYSPQLWGDSKRYLDQANHVLEGRGFGDATIFPTYVGPGYALFLAGIKSFSDSLTLIRCIHFALSIATCYLVYASIRPSSYRAAIIGLGCIALSPYAAGYVGYILSETFATFLCALLVFEISRIESHAPRPIRSAIVGTLCIALLLTAPATLFLAFGLWCYVAWNIKRHAKSLCCLIVSSILAILPWQLHCFEATGSFQPAVFSLSSETGKSPFTLWYRTWGYRADDIGIFWFSEKFVELPDSLFASKEERQILSDLHRNLIQHKADKSVWMSPKLEPFRAAAIRRIADDPYRFHILLPLKRSVETWLQLDLPWQRTKRIIEKLTFLDATDSVPAVGTILTIIAGGLACLLFNSVPIVSVFGALIAVRRHHIAPFVIILCVFTYTFVGAFNALIEIRRNIPYYPAMLFVLFYINAHSIRRPSTPEPIGPETFTITVVEK